MLKPVVLNISNGFMRKDKTLMDYRSLGINRHVGAMVDEAKLALSDSEVKVILFWALLSPGAALAYMIWAKYAKLRPFAALIFVFSLVQLVGQWGGIYFLLGKLGLAPHA